ncbi:hypothetical protein [Roseimarinus sediminis]|uniref:hypothetical protein n=1 Tax=Roseimarinus sediminis TaxID=1610899 RepID=UPI003D246418
MKLQIFLTRLLLFAAILILSSCVAKKKFVAMEASRNRAQSRVLELTQQLKQWEGEFNSIKKDFHYNDVQKQSVIDSLQAEINDLNQSINSTMQNSEDRVNTFQVEKRRLNQMLAEKDRELSVRQKALDESRIQLEALKDKVNSLSTDKQSNALRLNKLEEEKVADEAQLSALNKELDSMKKQLDEARHTIASRNEELNVLRNQVKLLKEELAKP